MLNFISRPLVRLVDRWLPDPYIFVVILTIAIMAAAILIEGHSPMAVIGMWGAGFWELLSFAMQMLLVLVTGYMMASTPLVRRVLERLADLAGSPGSAILLVSFVSLTASWIKRASVWSPGRCSRTSIRIDRYALSRHPSGNLTRRPK